MEPLPPNKNDENFGGAHYGAKAIVSSSGGGVVVQSYEFLYQLTCDCTNCTWTKMPEKLKHGLRWGITTSLPGTAG